MTNVPVACSLTPGEAGDRVEEWRQFVNCQVVAVERGQRVIRLQLENSTDAVLAAADLARREKACCPFFDFRLVLLPEAVWLVVEAPEEAAALLNGLAGLRRDL